MKRFSAFGRLTALCLLAVLCTGTPALAQETWADVTKAYRSYQSLKKQGNYRGALPHAQRVVELVRKVKGENDPNYATALNNLALLHTTMGDYAQAEPLYKQALEISKKVHGDQHPDVATGLNNLAGLYCAMGAYAQAEPLLEQTLEMRRKLLGDEHAHVAQSLNDLAWLHSSLGAYAQAEPLYKQALEINKKVHGQQHPSVATSLDNLAGLYRAMGAYAQAEPLHRQALEMRRKLLGDEHPDVATTLNNLAGLYDEMGAYAQAEPLYKEALEIDRKVYGDQHPDVAIVLSNLAALYHAMGAYAQAEPLFKQALEIKKKVYGEQHSSVATSLNNLAVLYKTMGAYAKAEPIYKQALEIWKKVHGEEHPHVAMGLNNLAELYGLMGEYARAEPLYKQALGIYKKVHGERHQTVPTSLNNLAVLYAATARPREALRPMVQAQTIRERQVHMVLGFTAEARQLAFLRAFGGGLPLLLTLVARDLPDDADAVTAAADAVLRGKGLTLAAVRRQREAMVLSGDPELEQLFGQLTQVRQDLARATFAGPGRAGPQAHRQKLTALEQQRDELEAKLARASAAFATERRADRADAAAVAAALPAGSALVELARPHMCDFKATGKQPKWKPARYLAFVISAKPRGHDAEAPLRRSRRRGHDAEAPLRRSHRVPGKVVGKGTPVLVDLGPADKIDDAVKAFLSAVGRERGHAAAQADLRSTATALYQLVFQPLEPALRDVDHVIISPEGQLCLVPFEAFCDGSGQYLAERCRFSYLSTGRDVIRYASAAGTKAATAASLIVADPDFDLGCSRQLVLAKAAAHGDTLVRGRRSADLSQLHFKRLPGTAAEADRVADMLRGAMVGTAHPTVEVRRGAEAIEAAVKAGRSPRVLHLASHAFFLEDQSQEPAAAGQRGQRGSAGMAVAQPFGPRPPAMKVENPLLRSGVALAGANRWAETARLGRVDDGLLTALEVSGMQLTSTELVVLSACDTGRGEVKVGEGVFGLRRAFVAAGARSLLMSLWKVPDAETVELMERFYRGWLSGKTKSEALREAQLGMMRNLREKRGAAHPRFWAGFVLVGDWK